MSEPTRANALVLRALDLYDVDRDLAIAARASVATGFDGGLRFMGTRSGRTPARGTGHVLGFAKYGACLAFALAVASAIAAAVHAMPESLAAILAFLTFAFAFYALESRWVFVFPAAAYGETHPFRTSWSLTARTGGTLATMRVVLPIAAHMLFGPLCGKGVVRAWATGCLAVLLWYEDVRGAV
jgi:hypothetical protein